MNKVKVFDNGSGFCITVNGLIVSCHRSLGDAWRRIAWMFLVASQRFLVGEKEIPAATWYKKMIEQGYLTENECYHPRNID